MDDKLKKPERTNERDIDINKGAKPDLNESYIPDFVWTPPAPPAGSIAESKPESEGPEPDGE